MDILADMNIFELCNDDDNDNGFMERRPYTIKNKPNNFQVWDDVEFFQRFRLKKNTVLELLHEIEDRLLIFWNRYVFCSSNEVNL